MFFSKQKLKKGQQSWVVLKALQGKINPLPRSSPRPLHRFSARPLSLAFFFFVFCFGKGCAASLRSRGGSALCPQLVSPSAFLNLIFYIMSKVHKFKITVFMPHGGHMVTTILAQNSEHALDLLYYRERFQSRQPDRKKYVVSQLSY
jgi:hypothetical protein